MTSEKQDLLIWFQNLVELSAKAKSEEDKPCQGLIEYLRKKVIKEMDKSVKTCTLHLSYIPFDRGRIATIDIISSCSQVGLHEAKRLVDNFRELPTKEAEMSPLMVRVYTDSPEKVSSRLKDAGVRFMLKALGNEGEIKEVYSVLR